MRKYDRIKQLCKEQGKFITQMEKDLGFSKGSISKIDIHNPSMVRIAKIAAYLDTTPDYIMTGEFPKDKDVIYDVAAGNGRINDGYGNEERASDTNPEYSKIRIYGDSMLPVLHDGDIVRVHHVTENISPSDFAIVKINGEESTCKHIEITDDGIWLKAENKDVFKDRFYSVQDVLMLPVTIIGVATEIISRLL